LLLTTKKLRFAIATENFLECVGGIPLSARLFRSNQLVRIPLIA